MRARCHSRGLPVNMTREYLVISSSTNPGVTSWFHLGKISSNSSENIQIFPWYSRDLVCWVGWGRGLLWNNRFISCPWRCAPLEYWQGPHAYKTLWQFIINKHELFFMKLSGGAAPPKNTKGAIPTGPPADPRLCHRTHVCDSVVGIRFPLVGKQNYHQIN